MLKPPSNRNGKPVLPRTPGLAQDKVTKSLRVVADRNSVVLEDRELPWKYWMEIYRTPLAVARELRQIAKWLERF